VLALKLHAFVLDNPSVEDIGENPVDPASGKGFASQFFAFPGAIPPFLIGNFQDCGVVCSCNINFTFYLPG
jgi:hypothetical protein